jgi:hypothetical protein
VDGWVGVKAVLRIAYSNQQSERFLQRTVKRVVCRSRDTISMFKWKEINGC